MTETATRSGRWNGRTESELATRWGVPCVEAWTAIGSTSDRAAALLREGSPLRSIVVAERQTAGRGRRGATWMSEAGAGVWLSILLGPDAVTEVLPLVAGVACAEAIEAVVPSLTVSVKWPNDLMVGERKVGGILVEVLSSGSVVGIGLNTTGPAGGFRGDLAEIATSIAAHTTATIDPVELVRGIVARLDEVLAAADPRERTVANMRERDALRDRAVSTETAGAGVARGVDDAGALLLERADGSTVRVVSGSVRMLPRRA